MTLTLTRVGIGEKHSGSVNRLTHNKKKHISTLVGGGVFVAICLMPFLVSGQEVLLPVKHKVASPVKEKQAVLRLPFFDDFSNAGLSQGQWQMGGAYVNEGYAPLPPTRGMITLDAFDAQGNLYPTATEQLFSCDTLTSLPIRLDSLFYPYKRLLTAGDSVYLSFFYLPGGGYGNMWERVGDCPEDADSLILEFYDSSNDSWEQIWSTGGVSADSLYARTGRYWQFYDVCIEDPRYFNANFRFRFRNYSSLSNLNKKGIISNADQWNIDYVVIDAGRSKGDTASRDVAFVLPAPTMLKRYQAMPARQFNASEMAQNLQIKMVNMFTEELATDYRYRVFSEDDIQLYEYDGGYENIPVYWHNMQYQSSPAHAQPPVSYSFPISDATPKTFKIVHTVREGVSGDAYASNDTASFIQVFDNYYAYDDGTPENGYGITSTSSRMRLACRFDMNVEDTLTAVYMYFNKTLEDQNAAIRFSITVWDDAGGKPGNIIYQDAARRSPLFEGFNKYVRYVLDEPVVCSGTIYVGFEQYSSDYINLGFDRNNDASANIFYLSSTSWQTSILRGALMLRPYFGHKATLAINELSDVSGAKIYVEGGRLVVELSTLQPVLVFNVMGQQVFNSQSCSGAERIEIPNLNPGLYFVRIGSRQTKKIIIPFAQ